MSDIDIVERLQGAVCYVSTNAEWPNKLLLEAADTIESQAKQLAKANAEVKKWTQFVPSDDSLKELQKQADCNFLAPKQAYINGLEWHLNRALEKLKESQAREEALREALQIIAEEPDDGENQRFAKECLERILCTNHTALDAVKKAAKIDALREAAKSIQSTVVVDTTMDDWTHGYEEAKKRNVKYLERMAKELKESE